MPLEVRALRNVLLVSASACAAGAVCATKPSSAAARIRPAGSERRGLDERTRGVLTAAGAVVEWLELKVA